MHRYSTGAVTCLMAISFTGLSSSGSTCLATVLASHTTAVARRTETAAVTDNLPAAEPLACVDPCSSSGSEARQLLRCIEQNGNWDTFIQRAPDDWRTSAFRKVEAVRAQHKILLPRQNSRRWRDMRRGAPNSFGQSPRQREPPLPQKESSDWQRASPALSALSTRVGP